MWPILATFFFGLCVILDRSIWWLRFKSSVKLSQHEACREALGSGDYESAWQITETSKDPYVQNLGDGLRHANTSMLAAMQLHAQHLIEKAEARMWIISTLITLAPLLGLFGTVVGLMRSFSSLDDDALAATEVSGGIGEALIATACGIGIAIICLLPYNYFRKRVATLRGRLERWINHSELLVHAAKEHGHDLEEFASKKLKS